MSIFLSEHECALIKEHHRYAPLNQFYWALMNRVERRASSPGLSDRSVMCDWWHFAAEYLTDGAMAYALKPSKSLACWVRDVALSISRRPVEDWIGPDFRNHDATPPIGHLETAHLTWAVAVAIDLAPEVFTEDELREIAGALKEKGIQLCLRWIDSQWKLANWRCVLNAGVAVAAAVLNDAKTMARAADEFRLCLEVFQPDGSYGESLQYGNYAAFALMLAREALTRREPAMAKTLPVERYARKSSWDAYSLLYVKPLSGWSSSGFPRSANFNDSAAIFRPSADLLLHIAARSSGELSVEAGLARWLFDTTYQPYVDLVSKDRATFGFVNDFGFLTLPLLPQAVDPISPQEAGLPLTTGFSCGDSFSRDAWDGRTVLAMHGGSDPLCAVGHLHGDVNSFILAHNRERFLADPGHSCYRNLIHQLESSTETHNTCTFVGEDGVSLEQSRGGNRLLDRRTGEPGPAFERGAKRLLAASAGPVSVLASEAALLYGAPLEEFSRFCILCGPHVLFVADRIAASKPVKTTWNWLLNNRDGLLDLKLVRPDRLVARRGAAGIKMFHLGGARMHGPIYSYVHDAYHPLPGQLGEGKPGSGMLMRWCEGDHVKERTVLHAFAMDDAGTIAAWHLGTDEGRAVIEGPSGSCRWTLQMSTEPFGFHIQETVAGLRFSVEQNAEGWRLQQH